MQLITAVILGKLIAYFTRLLKIGGGSAAPGLYALSIEPDLVEKLAVKIPKNVIITGTNGKTTTAKMLSHFAKAAGLKVIINHTGSNLERGIASALIANYTLYPKPYVSEGKGSSAYTLDLGIWELDEAAFNAVAPKLQPDIIVFLNVFRDQLDRYGEIDTVVKKWCLTLEKIPSKTQVLVNGDDQNLSKLSKAFKGSIQKFGVKDYKIKGEAIEYKKERENLNFEAKNIHSLGLKGSSFQIHTTSYQLPATLPLPGIYHIYDALAAFACAHYLNIPVRLIIDSLKKYTPAFGRVEKLPFGHIFLIKNPAGATQVFETIAPSIKPQDRLFLALNDNLADGTDVSWIWDAEFERLRQTFKGESAKLQLIVSGSRAYDLANRLKYAGFDPKTIEVESDLEKALREAKKGLKGQLFILPTYTAMLKLQSLLAKSGFKKQYWEEE